MILVFKTNINTKTKVRKLKPQLNKLLAGSRWNFDLDDCDHILRIDSRNNVAQPLITKLQELGFSCEELQ